MKIFHNTIHRRNYLYVHCIVDECFGLMRQVEGKGPLVCSEYYTGMVAYWNESRPSVNFTEFVQGMKYMLSINASFNFLMFHGGTNFGFKTGGSSSRNMSDIEHTHGYTPQLTTYDFTAPLNEAGDPTGKYYVIKQALKEAVI